MWVYNSLTQFQSSLTARQEMIHQNDNKAYNTEKNINNTVWCQKWQMNVKPKFDTRLAIAISLVFLSNFDLYIKANQRHWAKATARKMKEEGTCISEPPPQVNFNSFSPMIKKSNQFLVSVKINTCAQKHLLFQGVLFRFIIKLTQHLSSWSFRHGVIR